MGEHHKLAHASPNFICNLVCWTKRESTGIEEGAAYRMTRATHYAMAKCSQPEYIEQWKIIVRQKKEAQGIISKYAKVTIKMRIVQKKVK